jgi:dolichol-phosphate mannosyltransferase
MISVILPTYNEKENLEKLTVEILNVFRRNKISGNIIIVDDASPDGTGVVAKNLSKRFSGQVFFISRPKKMGLGSAYILGFKKALLLGSDFIFEMDADFSHSANDIPRFLQEAKNYDLVLGSRYIKGGKIKNWNIVRRLVSRGGTLYAKAILGLKICDLTSGFKCFRRKVLEKINLGDIKSDGYSFQIELTYKAAKLGFKIKEIPITFSERKNGISKFSKKIFWEAVFMVWKLRFDKF